MLVQHTLSVLPFVAFAYGGPLIGRNPQCNTGSMQCCQRTESASSPVVQVLASVLAELSDLGSNTQVGLQCSSLTGAGSGAECDAKPVCCTNTTSNALVNVGCSPIDV